MKNQNNKIEDVVAEFIEALQQQREEGKKEANEQHHTGCLEKSPTRPTQLIEKTPTRPTQLIEKAREEGRQEILEEPPFEDVKSRGYAYAKDFYSNIKIMNEKKEAKQAVIHGLIERFEFLEEETGTDFSTPRRIILRFAERNGLFIPKINNK